MNDESSKINVNGSNFTKLFPKVEKNIKYLNSIYFRPNNTMSANGLIKSFIGLRQQVKKSWNCMLQTKQLERKHKFTLMTSS